MSQKVLPPGIYAPTPAFFLDDDSQSIDTAAASKHALRLAKAGITGIVLHGSTGEAVHLTPQERKAFIERCRSDLDESGYKDVKIIAGAGGQSFNESLALLKDAQAAGADAGIVLSPSYFPDQMTDSALEAYFTKLSDASPLPFIIYNFPRVTNGINLSGPLLAKLASRPNIIGCKLTCHSISKMTYLAPYGGNLPGGNKEFSVFAGGSDYLVAAYSAGVAGAITGVSNLFPHTVVALWKALNNGEVKRAQELQAIVTRAETVAAQGFIPATRAALRSTVGYGGKSRSPLFEIADENVKSWTSEIWALEKELSETK